MSNYNQSENSLIKVIADSLANMDEVEDGDKTIDVSAYIEMLMDVVEFHSCDEWKKLYNNMLKAFTDKKITPKAFNFWYTYVNNTQLDARDCLERINAGVPLKPSIISGLHSRFFHRVQRLREFVVAAIKNQMLVGTTAYEQFDKSLDTYAKHLNDVVDSLPKSE